MPKTITIALTGNPNSGKTTIFNNLTGARQKVGNWGGVTVEMKKGLCRHGDYSIRVVDLPGTYSLTAYSIEEIIARNYIVEERPDVVVDVIDASNLERNLYLATQLIELDVKLIFVLNMADVAKNRGFRIDAETLGRLLGVPVVFTVGTRNEGTKEVLDKVVQVYEDSDTNSRNIYVHYGREIEEEIVKIQNLLNCDAKIDRSYSPRWLSVKLLENDPEVRKTLQQKQCLDEKLVKQVNQSCEHLKSIFKDDPESVITERRYGFISGALRETMKSPPWDRRYLSDQIDKILTNRLLGFPLFFFFIWLMFKFTFDLGNYPMEWIDQGVVALQSWVRWVIPSGLFRDLLVEGILSGVGSVLVFLPNIFILFFCIAIFEDTGYMARAAFIMDKIMHSMGLHGKSFIPMIMGFGCTVPAIMATRTLESRRDRFLTILLLPLISCSARLPVYILLAGAFFHRHAGNVIFSIYILGIVLVLLLGQIFKRVLFPGQAEPFVLELPPYRMPTLKGLVIHMWERGSLFLKKMGTVILVGAVIVWFLSTFPRQNPAEHDVRGAVSRGEVSSPGSEVIQPLSYLEKIGYTLEPLVTPLGFDWRHSVALLTGFVAKEVIISTMGVLYHVKDANEESESLRQAIRSSMTPLTAYALMAFVLIYTPCLATVAAIRRETGSWRWAHFSVGVSLLLAWAVAFVIYRAGQGLGFS
ncbi:MAG: ferrous iron transport protein B [Deltaproteobacteria bacterium]|nr:ferrous iron transport protein B [Deltaproteobacteria bacterium]MBW2305625.1 ferrous iron transport protein B [Deltaproteobacteria bacterium]